MTLPTTITHTAERPIYAAARPSLQESAAIVNLLIIASFAIDLFVPLLSTHRIVPDAVKYLSDILMLAVVFVLFFRIVVFDQFPVGFWLILGISIIGATQAMLQGQDWGVTLWGWWELFQFPLLAIFAFLNRHWPEDFPRKFRQLGVAIIIMQVLIQLVQYATGEPIGDHLAGTFGRHGVSKLLTLLVFVVCLTLGYGVKTGKWRTFLLVFGLGIVSSVLAENKIFPVATFLLAGGAVGVYLFLGGKLAKLAPYAAVLLTGLVLFFIGYNALVPSAERRSLDRYLFDSEARETYNTLLKPSSNDTTDFEIGRNFALTFAWDFISNHVDPSVFAFGLGIGARTESSALGLVGLAFEQDGLGLTLGTGIMVLLQEMGIMGLVVLGSFIVVVAYHLLKAMWVDPAAPATELRAALLLFTLLWPLWLWYKPVFEHRATMTLYWVALGYVYYEWQQRHVAEVE